MLKKIVATLLIIGMLILPGCSTKSNFQTHSDNLAKRSMYNDITKKQSLKYAFEALGKIMSMYEKEIVQLVPQKSSSLFKYTAYDNTGKKVIGVYEVADVTAGYTSIVNNLTITSSRERVVREFVPIFESIANNMVEAGNAPKSWIDVASEFVKHVPFMASMGAMYGLTSMAIDKAGNTINANLSDNAQLNNNNVVGNGNATDGSSVQDISGADIANDKSTTGIPEEEVPEGTMEE